MGRGLYLPRVALLAPLLLALFVQPLGASCPTACAKTSDRSEFFLQPLGAFSPTFAATVRFETARVAEQDRRDLDRYRSLLEDWVALFPLPAGVPIPKHPIVCEITFSFFERRGTEYVVDLRMDAFRPVYGLLQLSPLMRYAEQGLVIELRSEEVSPMPAADLPQDKLLRHITYLLVQTLGLYYDSFGLLAGDPFYDYLDKHSAAFLEGTGYALGHDYRSPLEPVRWLSELQTVSGLSFRESWYVYHRQGVDRLKETPKEYAATVQAVLRQLESLHALDPAHPILTFFADTKLGEIVQSMQSLPRADYEALSQQLKQLYPTYSSILQ